MAERQEVARAEGDAHTSIALWLGKHPVLGEGEVVSSPSPFEAQLSVPGHTLVVKARLFADDTVWELFSTMRRAAYAENELVRTVQLAMQSSEANDPPPDDASRDLRELREDWIAARTELEVTLRRASRHEA
jgi:hypothetical protein